MRTADLRQTLWEGHLRVLFQEIGAQVQVPENVVRIVWKLSEDAMGGVEKEGGGKPHE